MSGPMVRACLREIDPKEQTRRVVKFDGLLDFELGADGVWHFRTAGGVTAVRCPYGVPGDRLYVREAFRLPAAFDAMSPGAYCAGSARVSGPDRVHFEADGEQLGGDCGKLRPGIHMPRQVCRLVLEVTEVRVERLQDISEADALAEGIIEYEPTDEDPAEFSYVEGGDIFSGAHEAYRYLWHRINGETGPNSWAANPWVFAISFVRVTP